MHDFWRFRNAHVNVNIKSMIDHRYADLTYEEYRGYNIPGHRQLSFDERDQIDIDISGTDGQAYLALKALQDDENSYNMFREFYPQNYTLSDIVRYEEYAGSFWYFLDRSDRTIYDFNRVNRFYLDRVDELHYKIMGSTITRENYRDDLRKLFSYFNEDVFPKCSYLIEQNTNSYQKLFKNSFLNMLWFLVLLILSMFLYVIDGGPKFNYVSTLLLVSVFISNTVDLLIITFNSIVAELEVSEVYEL